MQKGFLIFFVIVALAPQVAFAGIYQVSAEADSWIKEASPFENHGAGPELFCKRKTGDNFRAIYRFDLSSIPAGAPVLAAFVTFYVSAPDVSGLPVKVHRITQTWTEMGVSWASLGTAYDSLTVHGSFTPFVIGAVMVDITSLVEDWVNGTYTNHGLMLVSSSNDLESKYASKEWPLPGQRPRLTVITLDFGNFMETGSYNGNDLDSRAITGVGFSPDFVIIKGDNNQPAVARSSTMSGDASKTLSASDPLESNLIQSLENDGFTVGNDARVNGPGVTYYWTVFRSVPGLMQVGSYTGNDVDNRSITGAGFHPGYVIVMCAQNQDVMQRYNAQAFDKSLLFVKDGEKGDRIQDFEPDGFQVGKHDTVNKPGVWYHYAAWNAVTGIAANGLYVGDEADDRDITGVGFQPDYLIVAGVNQNVVHRSNRLTGDSSLPIEAGIPFANAVQSFLPDGFQVGDSDEVNKNGDDYFWAAFRRNSTASADLELTVTVDDSLKNESEAATLFISLLNIGPDAATGIMVTDFIPPGLTYSTHGATQGEYSSTTGVWDVGELPAGLNAGLFIVVTVDPGTAGSVITDYAYVTAAHQPDPVSANNSDAARIVVTGVRLPVTKSVDSPNPNAGDNVNYYVTVTNDGPSDATGVEVLDQLPAGVTYVSDTPSQGIYVIGTGRWSVGAIAYGDSATITLTASVDPGTGGDIITNTAYILAADQPLVGSGGDSSSVDITVQSSDLSVGKTVDDPTPSVTDLITYTIMVANAGPDSATGVQLADTLPAGVTYSLDTPSQGSYNAVNGIWDVGAIAPGDTAKLSIAATVDAGTQGRSINNIAVVSAADQEDPDAVNNASFAKIIVQSNLFRVETGTYSGNGAGTRSIAGVGFTPDVVILQGDDGAPAAVKSSSLPGAVSKGLAWNDALYSDVITSLDADGFTVSPNGRMNQAGSDYYWIAFRTAPGHLVAGSYNGDGSDDRAVTGLGFRPSYAMILPESYNQATQRYPAHSGDASTTFGYSGNNPNWIQAFLPDGFQVGSDSLVNAPGLSYHYVAWKETAGLIAGGSYFGQFFAPYDVTGLGLQPEYAFVKSSTSANGTVHRPEALAGDQTLSIRNGYTYAQGIRALLADGFRVGTDASVNIPTVEYYYMAFSNPSVIDADLEVTMAVSDTVPILGDTLTYTVTLINNGPYDAAGVQVIDMLPAELTYLSGTPDQGTYNDLTGLWNIGAVSAGNSINLLLTASLDGGEVDSTFTNSAAIVAYLETDPDESNNTASADVRIGPSQFRLVSGSYVGDGSGSRALTGIGFQPDLVIVKGDDSESAVAKTTTMTGGSSKPLGLTIPAQTGQIISLDEDGFTVGSNNRVNKIGITYYWSAFRAARPELTVGTYNGNGSDDRSIGGLDFTPAYVMVMNEAAVGSVQRYPSHIGDVSMPFYSDDPAPNQIQTFEADGFRVGSSSTVNAAGNAYHYVAWKNVVDRCTGGLYVGDETDDRDITGTSFRPEFVLIRRGDKGSPAVFRNNEITGDNSLPINTAPALSNGIQALLADGFQIGSHDHVNKNASSYYWMAFDDDRTVDLSVSKNVDNPTPNVGDTLSFTVSITNSIWGDATRIGISDVLPDGLTYVADSTSQGSYNSGTGLWTVGDLGAGTSADLLLSATVDPGRGGEDIVNSSSLTVVDQVDTDAGNNVATAGVTVRSADLSVSKSVDRPAPLPGDTIIYTVALSNAGPYATANVLLRDSLPAGVTYLTDSATQGSYDAGTGIWTLPTVPMASSDTLTITAVVDSGTGGTYIVNAACVSASGVEDTDSANDTALVEIFVPTPVTLDDVPGSLFPPSAVVGDPDLALRIGVDNPWPVGVTLSTTSTVIFSDSTSFYEAALRNPTYVPPGAGDFVLAFSSASLSADFAAGASYSLLLSLEGTTDEELAFEQFIPTAGTNEILIEQSLMLLSAPVIGNHPVNPGQAGVELLVVNFQNDYSEVRNLDSLTVTNAASGPGSQAQLDQLTAALELYDDVDSDNILSGPDTLLDTAVFVGGRASFALDSGWTVEALSSKTLIVAAGVDSAAARDGDWLDVVVTQPADFVFAEPSPVTQTISPANPLDSYGHATVDGMVSFQITVTPSSADTLLSGADDVHLMTVVLPQNGYEADTLAVLNVKDYSGSFDPADFSGLQLYYDDGDGVFEPWQDQVLGDMVYSGDRYEVSGLAAPVGPGGRLFVAADVSVNPTDGDRFRPGIPLDGVDVYSNNDGPIDVAVVSSVSLVIVKVEKIDVYALPLPAYTPQPGDDNVTLLRLNVQNNTLQAATLDSLRLVNRTSGPGNQTQLDAETARLRVYQDDGNGVVDAWEEPLTNDLVFVSGALTTPSLDLVFEPGQAVDLLVACDVDSFCVRDQDSLRVQVPASGDLFFDTALPVNGTFPVVTQQPRAVNGMKSFQLTVIPSADSLLVTETSGILVLDVLIPGNGYDADTLRSLDIRNQGTATDEHLETLSLYADGGNGLFETGGGDDVYIGDFVSLGAKQYQLSAIDYPLPPSCPGGTRFFVACALTSDFLTGATLQFGIPVLGVEVDSGNDGPTDVPAFDPSTMFLPKPDEVTVVPYTVGDKRVYPGSTNVLNFGLIVYNGYATTVTLDSIRLFQTESAVGSEIVNVKAFADTDNNGLFNPVNDELLVFGFSTDPYYYRFTNLGVDLKPEKISYLFVTYDLAGNARDSVGVDLQLNGISELSFTPGSISITGELQINSPGVDYSDGMIAAQIGLSPARAVRVAPGDNHVLVMGFTIPSNGFASDQLNFITVLNAGTALAGQDIDAVHLWTEYGGDPGGFAPGDDRLLGTLSWTGSGWKNSSSLKALIPVTGLKCYVTFDTSPTAVDDQTFQAVLPTNGIRVLSGNDGPLDQSIVNPNVQSISTDPLITSIATDRGSYSTGQDVIVSMQVRNEGADTLHGVTAPALTVTGSGSAAYQNGPVPAVLDLVPDADTTLVWLYTAAAAGGIEFCGFVHNGDSTVVSLETCSETIVVQNKPASISVTLTDVTPIGVNRGQENVDAISLSLDYAGYDSLYAPVRLKGLAVSLEDGSGAPVAPNSVLREMTLVNSSGSNQPFSLIDSTSNPVHLFLQQPVDILPGDVVGVDVQMDISNTASVSSFRLILAAAGDVSVEDANDGLFVPLAIPSGFPWRTNLIDVTSAAESLLVYTDDSGVQFANLGQRGVNLFGFKLLNTGPPTSANEILKSLVLSFYDTTGAAIPPNHVLNSLSIVSNGSVLYATEDIPSSGNSITCNLTNSLLLPPQAEKEVSVPADLKSFPQAGGFRVSLQNSSSVTARDNNSGSLILVAPGGPFWNFPVSSPAILFQAPASGISVVHTSKAPRSILPSSTGVSLLELGCTHADTSGTSSSIAVDSLAMVFINRTGTPVYPGNYFSQLRVVNSGDTICTLPSLSSIDNLVECKFSVPVMLSPADVETLSVYVDAKNLYSPAEFQVRIDKEYVFARDLNTGERILSVAGNFPLFSDLSRLLLPGGSVVCGLASRLPGNVSGRESALPVFDFIVKNNDPPGYTPSELRSLDIGVRSWNGKAISPEEIVAGAVLLDGDSVLAAATVTASGIFVTLPDSAVITAPGTSDTLTFAVDLDAAGEHTFRFTLADTSSIGIRDAVTLAGVAAGTVGNTGYPLNTAVAHLLGTDQGKAFTNYPNPFAAGREATRITYYLDWAARVTLKLYTLWGAPVLTLMDGEEKSAGLHQDAVWWGKNSQGDVVNNGVYYLVLEVEGGGKGAQTYRRKVGVIR